MLHKSGLRVKYKPYQLYANDLQRQLPLVQLFSDLYITTLLSASGRLHLTWNSLLEAYGLCVWPVSMKLTCNAQTYASNMQTVPSQVKSTVRACMRACVCTCIVYGSDQVKTNLFLILSPKIYVYDSHLQTHSCS